MDQEEISQALAATEQALLGAAITDVATYWKIAASLNARDFLYGHHRIIFNAIKDELEDTGRVERLLISRRIELSGKIEDSVAFVDHLVSCAANEGVIDGYVTIVLAAAVNRNVRKIAQNIAEQPHLAESLAQKISEERARLIQDDGTGKFKELLSDVVAKIHEDFDKDSDITGLASGFVDLDEMTAGFQPGELILVAGRPAMGKSVFGQNIAENCVFEEKRPVLIISCEMSKHQYATRMISSQGRVSATKLRRPRRMEDDDWSKMSEALSNMMDAPVYIEDLSKYYRVSAIRHKALQIKRIHGDLGAIVIDYIQLMDNDTTAKMENRHVEVSAISRALKHLAKELQVPVIALAQLSRKVEERTDKRPQMADLKESGSLEQDADLILMLYREEYYKPDTPDKGTAEVILEKQRHGPLGTVKTVFLGEFMRFENLASDNYKPDYITQSSSNNANHAKGKTKFAVVGTGGENDVFK